MESLVQISSVPLIVFVVYTAILLYKNIVGLQDKFVKFIPVIAAVLGMVLGAIAFYAVPDIVAADNVFTAVLVGGSSGLAATGTSHIFSQLNKSGKDNEEEEKPNSENEDENPL